MSRILIIITAALIGGGLRFHLASQLEGSEDLISWTEFAHAISDALFFEGDIGAVYRNFNRFNHPLPAAIFAGLTYKLSELFGVEFGFLFRAFLSLVDCLTAFAILCIVRANSTSRSAVCAALIWLISPLAIIISGFHGNTDSIYVCLIAFGLAALGAGYFRTTGLLVGLSTGIKVLPLLLFPAFCLSFLAHRERKKLLSWLVIGSVPCLLGLAIGSIYWNRVFLYHPAATFYWGIGGLLQLMGESKSDQAIFAKDLLAWYRHLAPYVVVVSVIVVPYYLLVQRKQPLLLALAISYLFALLLSPGIGVQYLLLVGMLMLTISWKDGVFFSCLFSFYAYTCYNPQVLSYFPDGRLESYIPSKIGVFLGFVVFAGMIDFIIRQLRPVKEKACGS